MRILIALFCIIIAANCYSQSIPVESINRIKSATVKIVTDYGTGTGFFIDSKGTIATCWHVVMDAVRNNKPITAITISRDSIELKYPPYTDSGAIYAQAYDLFILKPWYNMSKPTTFLKLGNFNKVAEGQEVYTCGYPFGYPHPFVSKGIISSKYEEVKSKLAIQYALIDITSNHGNSGGPLMKLNTASKEDEVIGIIDFTATPIATVADSLASSISANNWTGAILLGTFDNNGKTISSYDPVQTSFLYAKWFATITYGINGIVSVNHLKALLKEIKQD